MTAMKATYYWIAVLMVGLYLWAAVTPWLVNQDSTLTLLAVPFLWATFGFAVKASHKKLFTKE